MKARQAMLHLYGDIVRTDEGNKVTQKMEVRRPRIRWMDNNRLDMIERMWF